MTAEGRIAALDASFARRRCSAGGLIWDQDGKIAVVRTSYRDGWMIPGGVVEAGETPAEALVREAAEEIGAAPVVRSMVCVDILPPDNGFSESVHFLFDCHPLDDPALDRLRIDGREILEMRFVLPQEALGMLYPTVSRRLAHVFRGASGYFEAGTPVVDQPQRPLIQAPIQAHNAQSPDASA